MVYRYDQTSNPFLDTSNYERGHTLCILNAEPLFGRNQIWYKVDDINTVEVRFSIEIVSCPTCNGHHLVQILPVSLARLWELNDRLRRRSDAGDLFKCLSCGNAGQFGCTVCDSQYCSTVRISIFLEQL